MVDSPVIIRPLTSAELEELLEWAACEGWNPGLADASAFHAADPQGFIGCFVDNHMAAAIAATAYGTDFGFIGLYISHPDYRGKGYGKRVWDAGMNHLQGRSIGLDGVPAQQDNYRKSGFVEQYRTWRWSGHLTGPEEPASDLVAVTPALLAAVEACDRQYFPTARSAFLAQWTSAPRQSLALLRGGEVLGYGTIRQCREGFKIGPLFAADPCDAERIFSALAVKAEGQTLHIDVPEPAAAFSTFLEKAGFEKSFVTARMVRGPAPAVERTPAGVTTLELG